MTSLCLNPQTLSIVSMTQCVDMLSSGNSTANQLNDLQRILTYVRMNAISCQKTNIVHKPCMRHNTMSIWARAIIHQLPLPMRAFEFAWACPKVWESRVSTLDLKGFAGEQAIQNTEKGLLWAVNVVCHTMSYFFKHTVPMFPQKSPEWSLQETATETNTATSWGVEDDPRRTPGRSPSDQLVHCS